MLERLLIKNFAVIEDLEVEFTSGFLALSGETGAGKSIIIDAISLLFGEKSSFDKIRNGSSKAFIEGVFRLENIEVIDKISEILDEEIEDNLLIITRSLDITNKSTIKVNSRTITLSILRKISPLIFDIHSQQKDNDYLRDENQLILLDKYLKSSENADLETFNLYLQEYNSYLDIQVKIDDLLQKQKNLGELDVLEYQFNELEKANIQEDEMEQLEEEKLRLSSFIKITDRLQTFLNEYSDASNHLYQAKKQLSYVNDEEFETLNEKFNEAYYLLDDTYQTINEKFETFKDKITHLEQIQDRLYFLHSLRKKYGYTTKDILSRFEEIKVSIDEIKNFDSYLTKLNNEKQAVLKRINNLSTKITSIRKTAAKALENDVNNQLRDLYLENAEFKIDFKYLDEFTKDGIDKVTFLLKANAGGSFLPLNKTASLGETSRLNLALKTVFNNLSPKETIIFDEIDIGISGRVATSIARKMELIAEKSQVIVISHLPQVTAGAKNHYYVEKEVRNDQTYSSIRLLDRQERVEVIAKMMGGDNFSDSSIQLANELLKSFNN